MAARFLSQQLDDLSSSHTFRNHLQKLCLCEYGLAPIRNLPALAFRDPPQTPCRIYRDGFSNASEQPAIIFAVAIRAAVFQVQVPLFRKPPRGDRFRFTKHRRAKYTAGPAAVFFFNPRGANKDLGFAASFCQLAAQPVRNFLREKFQRARDEHNSFAVQHMLRNAFHCRGKQRCSARRAIHLETGRADRSQIRFVSLQHMGRAIRRLAHGFFQPDKSIPRRNFSLVPQSAKESSFERWLLDKRSVHVEKSRRAAHAASRTTPALRGTEEVACAMYFQPSTSTGNPRTRQNAAVPQVRTLASVRIVMCASAASVPTNATGPRVSASSSPRYEKHRHFIAAYKPRLQRD